MFFPGETNDDFTGEIGIVDYDTAVFDKLRNTRSSADFLVYCRYYISDHRPLWAEFKI